MKIWQYSRYIPNKKYSQTRNWRVLPQPDRASVLSSFHWHLVIFNVCTLYIYIIIILFHIFYIFTNSPKLSKTQNLSGNFYKLWKVSMVSEFFWEQDMHFFPIIFFFFGSKSFMQGSRVQIGVTYLWLSVPMRGRVNL